MEETTKSKLSSRASRNTHSKNNNRRCSTKRTLSSRRSIQRKSNKGAKADDTIYSVKFRNFEELELANPFGEDSSLQVLREIIPSVKDEIADLDFKIITPGAILSEIFKTLIKKYENYNLLIGKNYTEQNQIYQVKSIDTDLLLMPIDKLIYLCDSDVFMIETLFNAIKLLAFYFNIDYPNFHNDYWLSPEYENLKERYNDIDGEEDEDRIEILKSIYYFRFSLESKIIDTIYSYNPDRDLFTSQIKHISKQKRTQEQNHLLRWFKKIDSILDENFDVSDLDFNVYTENGELSFSQSIQFVWTFNDNHPFDVVGMIEDYANNFGVCPPTFFNILSPKSKQVFIPKSFYKLIEIMNYGSFKRIE